MNKMLKHIAIAVIIILAFTYVSCYDEFKGPAGYADYYFDNQSNAQVFLEYKLSSREDGEIRLTSFIYADSMVVFHSDKLTEENPTPEMSFQWLKVYERLNDSTDILRMEVNPMVDSVWSSTKVTEFDIGERDWVFSYP